jgi:hypothetical protein
MARSGAIPNKSPPVSGHIENLFALGYRFRVLQNLSINIMGTGYDAFRNP